MILKEVNLATMQMILQYVAATCILSGSIHDKTFGWKKDIRNTTTERVIKSKMNTWTHRIEGRNKKCKQHTGEKLLKSWSAGRSRHKWGDNTKCDLSEFVYSNGK
jgi:hypothetical protein